MDVITGNGRRKQGNVFVRQIHPDVAFKKTECIVFSGVVVPKLVRAEQRMKALIEQLTYLIEQLDFGLTSDRVQLVLMPPDVLKRLEYTQAAQIEEQRLWVQVLLNRAKCDINTDKKEDSLDEGPYARWATQLFNLYSDKDVGNDLVSIRSLLYGLTQENGGDRTTYGNIMNALLRVLGKMEDTLPEENYSDQPPFSLELANRNGQGIGVKGLHESLVRLEGRRGDLMRLLSSLERHVESQLRYDMGARNELEKWKANTNIACIRNSSAPYVAVNPPLLLDMLTEPVYDELKTHVKGLEQALQLMLAEQAVTEVEAAVACCEGLRPPVRYGPTKGSIGGNKYLGDESKCRVIRETRVQLAKACGNMKVDTQTLVLRFHEELTEVMQGRRVLANWFETLMCTLRATFATLTPKAYRIVVVA